ncbi:MAG: LacI family DNA-binding transcriptional regulator [Lachnospiraceae bacterium]|nr:LacI family DNA-binding transcriptional regulator [Lachnospiraceae bacterium]
MASIKDIAKLCDVSVATVSKALNDKADISQETKQHIKRVAKEMGYVPQFYARAIRTNKSYNIGVLFMDDAMCGLTHDYFSHILNSFKVTAEENGYDITFINSNQTHQQHKTYLEHCRYRGLDGVMIACINYDNLEVDALVQSDIPVVTVDRHYPDTVSILSDNTNGMESLMEYIISQGHKRIAYLSGDESTVTEQRIASYRKTMKKHRLTVHEEYHVRTEYRNLEAARKYTKQLLSLPTPPTCIIYQDDYSAMGGLESIREMGLSVPNDISIAGYDDIFIASQLCPRLTTVHQDTEVMGQIAAERLIALIEQKKNISSEPIIVGSHLKKGGSVKHIKG